MVENIISQLQTPRLLLKGLTEADGEALFYYRSCPEVTKFQSWAPASVEDAFRFIDEDICHEMNQPDTWFQFGIFLKENQTMIGDLGIHFFAGENQGEIGQSKHETGDAVEIGITIAPEFQGSGYASEAVVHVLDFLFKTLDKNKVIASVDPKNHKSMALMKGAGFQLDAIYKNTVLFRGEWTDDAVFIMTREKWQAIINID